MTVSRITVLTALALCAGSASAQVIPVRLVPIAEAGQYEFFPAANFGMGSVSIALRDSLLDPFQNPALATRLGGGMYFGAPTFFSVTNDAGSGQSYPFGAVTRIGQGFIGGALTLQVIDPARTGDASFIPAFSSFIPDQQQQQNTPKSNYYFHGLVGHPIGRGLTLAASAQWSQLDAIEGMDLLFTDSHSLRQSGSRSDVRVGVLGEWGTHSLEVVALRSHARATYVADYAEVFWNPNVRSQQLRTWSQQSGDDLRTAGIHVKYDRPLRDSTWRAGAIFTMNRHAEHPADYYEFMDIPRDPARTFAYNVGIGVSRERAQLRYGFDAIVEPIWRHARTEPVTASPDLAEWAPEDVESYFRFANVLLRGGVSRDFVMSADGTRLRVQFGTQVRSVRYTLEQHDFGRSVYRERRNDWNEWTHSWGTSFVFPRFEFAYQLRMLSGLGRLNTPPRSDTFVPDVVFFPAPVGGVTLYPVRVTSHQVFFTWPLR